MTSILEGGIREDRIMLQGTEDTVIKSTKSLGSEIPRPLDAIVSDHVVGGEEAEGIGSQALTVILETLETPK